MTQTTEKQKSPYQKHITNLMELMKNNAQAYNNKLSDEYISTMSFSCLLAHCHPDNRKDFTKSLIVVPHE
jgi:hypothetical protein